MEHDPPGELFKETTFPDVLQRGEVIGVRPIWSGQNHIFLVQLHQTGHEPCLAIYKPSVGEAPLHDFPTCIGENTLLIYWPKPSVGISFPPP